MAKNSSKPTAKPAKTLASPKSLKPIVEKQTKAQIVMTIAEASGVSKKDVTAVLSALSDTTKRHLTKKGSGEFAVPELGVKLKHVLKPATKARKGRNPLTGEEITIKAKPATVKIRAVPLKSLKEIAL